MFEIFKIFILIIYRMYYTLNIFYLPDSVVGIVVVVLGCTIKIEIKIQFCNDFEYFPMI